MPCFSFYRRGVQYIQRDFDAAGTTIGRTSEAEIVLAERSIDPVAAIVTREEDGLWIRPGPRRHQIVVAGTSVYAECHLEKVEQGLSVDEARLEEGTEIFFGETTAIYHEHSARDRTQIVGNTSPGPLDPPKELPRELFLCAQDLGGTEPPLSVPLREAALIGRGEDATLRLEDPQVSDIHARVGRHNGAIILQDKNSRNGTRLAGIRVYETELPLGARFRIGRFDVWVAAQPVPASDAIVDFEGYLTRDPATRALLARIERAATQGHSPILLEGESGTGKGVIANAIHRRSPRAGGPFRVLNCGAVNDGMIENELFGHEKGAYTGAVQSAKGAFESADGGTLFLDEIGELDRPLQPRLLRATESGMIKTVGSPVERAVDVRIVSATNRNLATEVELGRFREDLYYRLNVARVELPPLRQRRCDIPLLWEHWIRRNLPPGAPMPELTPAASSALEYHDWPGNVRELSSVASRALSLKEPESSVIHVTHLAFDRRKPSASPTAGLVGVVGQTLAETERNAIIATLRFFEGNRTKAARALGIGRDTLRRKIGEWDLDTMFQFERIDEALKW